ncbi:MAG: hypothetical protein ACRD40_15810 [Candidatus Acidiferrales bacterium]
MTVSLFQGLAALLFIFPAYNFGRTATVAGNATDRITYFAFAQAGGFDANGAWGVGTDSDLNSAISAAENKCHEGALLCGDEGYCALHSGLWGAWASDLKVAGSSAFACNMTTESQARAQAQANCGSECKVLWSGAGKRD